MYFIRIEIVHDTMSVNLTLDTQIANSESSNKLKWFFSNLTELFSKYFQFQHAKFEDITFFIYTANDHAAEVETIDVSCL